MSTTEINNETYRRGTTKASSAYNIQFLGRSACLLTILIWKPKSLLNSSSLLGSASRSDIVVLLGLGLFLPII